MTSRKQGRLCEEHSSVVSTVRERADPRASRLRPCVSHRASSIRMAHGLSFYITISMHDLACSVYHLPYPSPVYRSVSTTRWNLLNPGEGGVIKPVI